VLASHEHCSAQYVMKVTDICHSVLWICAHRQLLDQSIVPVLLYRHYPKYGQRSWVNVFYACWRCVCIKIKNGTRVSVEYALEYIRVCWSTFCTCLKRNELCVCSSAAFSGTPTPLRHRGLT
jgi:hypothetical protein